MSGHLLLLGLVIVCVTAPVDAQPLFTGGVDLVHVGVTVLDAEGRLVKDLTVQDFEIHEEGKEQTIRYFTYGVDSDVERMPLHLGLLFDTSESMEEDGAFAKTAAIKFLNSVPQAVDMTLVEFDSEVRVGRYAQADFLRLIERIRNQQPKGLTALYDALGVYLDGAFSQDGRKILLLYTDGDDTRSRLRFTETMDLVKASDVTVYAVGFQKRVGRSARMMQRMRMEQLVESTGGRSFFPTSIEQLDGIYEQILNEINARYQIGYASTDERTDGRWRDIDVSVKSSRPGLRLRARGGYFAPFREPPP